MQVPYSTSLTITAFIAAMMLLIEYVHVLTAGTWPRRLAKLPGGPYLAAAVLGLIPGCLGSFAAVSMFNHGLLTLGALVTCMIATSGDEAIVLLALAPRQAPALMAALFVAGVTTGLLEACDFPRVRRIIAGAGQLYDFVGACALRRGRDPWILPGSTSGHIYVGILKAALEPRGLAGGPVRGPGDDLGPGERVELQAIVDGLGAPPA